MAVFRQPLVRPHVGRITELNPVVTVAESVGRVPSGRRRDATRTKTRGVLHLSAGIWVRQGASVEIVPQL